MRPDLLTQARAAAENAETIMPRWCDALSALLKVNATADLLTEAEYQALDDIRQQIEREANLP